MKKLSVLFLFVLVSVSLLTAARAFATGNLAPNPNYFSDIANWHGPAECVWHNDAGDGTAKCNYTNTTGVAVGKSFCSDQMFPLGGADLDTVYDELEAKFNVKWANASDNFETGYVPYFSPGVASSNQVRVTATETVDGAYHVVDVDGPIDPDITGFAVCIWFKTNPGQQTNFQATWGKAFANP